MDQRQERLLRAAFLAGVGADVVPADGAAMGYGVSLMAAWTALLV
jgi:hypothetical protein